jgi:hypothetical protein
LAFHHRKDILQRQEDGLQVVIDLRIPGIFALSTGPPGADAPTLLTNMSTRPKRSKQVFTIASTDAAPVTSHWWATI